MKKVILLVMFVPFMVHEIGNIQVITEPFPDSYRAKPGDIVITEIMADPVPVVELPPEEYIEIFNRTGNTIDLKNWRLSSADQNSYFPVVEIGPGDYLILCYVSDTSVLKPYGRVTGLKPFPALTDRGKVITLLDDQGTIISGVEYSSDWYGSTLKSGGGWSLEIIDTDYPFFAEGNWEASSSRKGGTPGSVNSSTRINPDRNFAGIINVFPKDSISILIEFSEPVIGFESRINRILFGESGISAAGLSDPLYRRFIITPEHHLERGRLYTLYLPPDITDFAGNYPSRMSYCFGLPEPPEKKDLVFNELLFNPLPDNPDYIEFFNLSEKVLDASELFLASVNDQTGIISESRQVT
ncbi:MAG TPA: hypothetical protein DDW27_11805, partial [Bacteroidales bacterium]|nr:hypothetical protein [Bacteroidales bacterium]